MLTVIFFNLEPKQNANDMFDIFDIFERSIPLFILHTRVKMILKFSMSILGISNNWTTHW